MKIEYELDNIYWITDTEEMFVGLDESMLFICGMIFGGAVFLAFTS